MNILLILLILIFAPALLGIAPAAIGTAVAVAPAVVVAPVAIVAAVAPVAVAP